MSGPLSAAAWARVEELFARASELAPEDRPTFLERTAPDEDVRREVESLLRFAGDDVSESLQGIVESGARALEAAADESAVGSRVGPFRVLREIGRGGMGVVYLAERVEADFDQQVALKLLPGALFDPAMIRRFREERRILASLEHPGVARFLDGGATPAGVPWVAMEFVDGEPLDAYCDRRALDLDARLALFAQVCDAVAYAHGRLIVHRDLKPGNILVDTQGRPKLLDFGIARLLDPDAEDGRTATMALTPQWASPEQVRGQRATTAADVYGLGALLYRLVSGRKPHEGAESRTELLRAITGEDPAPPSAVAQGPPLSADIDTMVLTAMRREPGERYASVDRLRQDVEAFRASRPIAARPQTAGYRLRKFVARNRAPVAAAAVACVALLVGGGSTLLGLARARAAEATAAREARTAQEVTGFLVDLFEDPRPDPTGAGETTARELLQRGVERIGRDLSSEPYLQARLRHTMGISFGRLGDYASADTLLVAALETVPPEDDAFRATILSALGPFRRDAGNLEGALEVLEEARELALARLDTADLADLRRTPELTRTLIDALGETGMAYSDLGEHDVALLHLERAHALALATFGEESESVVSTAGALAYGYSSVDRMDEALPLYERRVEILADRSERDPLYLTALENLASAWAATGAIDRAEEAFRRLLPLQEDVFGAEHPLTGQTLHNLGTMYSQAGRLDEAEEHLRRGLEINTAVYGKDALGITQGLNNLALVSQGRGDWAEAERLFARAAAIRRAELGPRNPSYASVLMGMGNARRNQGEWAGAAEAYREGLEVFRRLGPIPAVVLEDYAQVLQALGRHEEAEELRREAAETG